MERKLGTYVDVIPTKTPNQGPWARQVPSLPVFEVVDKLPDLEENDSFHDKLHQTPGTGDAENQVARYWW